MRRISQCHGQCVRETFSTLAFRTRECSVLDLKARYRGMKYLRETLKILPQKPDPIVIDQIAEHLGAIGAVHQIHHQLTPG